MTTLRIAAWLFLIFIAVSSLLPVALPETGVEHPDKILHFGVYALLTLIFLKAYKEAPALLVSAGILIFGTGLEAIQHVIPYRDGSIFDGGANALGILIPTGLRILRER